MTGERAEVIAFVLWLALGSSMIFAYGWWALLSIPTLFCLCLLLSYSAIERVVEDVVDEIEDES